MPEPYARMWADVHAAAEMPDLNATHLVTRFRGRFDVRAWGDSVQCLLERHPILRARVVAGAHGLGFEITDGCTQSVGYTDLSAVPRQDLETELQRRAHALVYQPMDPGLSLFRAFILEASATDFVLGVVIHHFIADAWSVERVARDLLIGYYCALTRRPLALPTPEIQFPDYLESLGRWLEGAEARIQAEYWARQMSNAPATTLAQRSMEDPELPLDLACQRFELDPPTLRHIATRAAGLGTTPFLFMLAVKMAVLSSMTGSADVVVSVAVEGRESPQLRNTVGFFCNYLPIRAQIDPRRTLEHLVREVTASYRSAYRNRRYPCWSKVAPGNSFPKLRYRRVLVSGAVTEGLRSQYQYFAMLPPPPTRIPGRLFGNHFLELEEVAGVIQGKLRYPASIYDADSMTRFANQFRAILQSGSQAREAPLSKII